MYPWVSWRNQTDPFNLVQVIAFTKSSIFSKSSIRNLLALTKKKINNSAIIAFFAFAVYWCLPELNR